MAILKTTFPRYIQKPSIVGNTNTQIKLIEANYRSRFDSIMVREGGLLTYVLYKDDTGNYYAHIKVPSEVVEKFYYDVIIKFNESKLNKFSPTLKTYDIQVFSNDPAFVYTYAYAFNTHGLFLKDFESKMGKYFLNTKAREKNPNSEIGYVKSLYFAYFIMEIKDLFKKDSWRKALPYKASSLSNNIMLAENKIALRQRLYEQKEIKKKKEEPTVQKPRNAFSVSSPHVKQNTGIINTKVSKIISKGTKTIGTIKRIGRNRKK